jgi:lysophospholipase L1-like esterase
MKYTFNRMASIAAASFCLGGSSWAGDFFIHDGDRVVFLGDSITEQRLYTTYIEAYALTRFPNWNLTFRNVGWGGDTAWLRQRAHPDETKLFAANPEAQQKMVEDSVGRGLARDVQPLKPTVVTIKFGMNDHAYQPFRQDIFNAYARSQTQIAKVLEADKVRVAFLTPQPIEDKRPDPDKDVKNQSLRRFSDGLKDVAAKAGALFIDQFDPYMSIMLAERAANPQAFIGGGDAVHPGPAGHTLMAWAVLKGLGAQNLVSSAEIDMAAQKTVSTEACQISNLKITSSGEAGFDRLDNALPLPVDPKAQAALKLAPVLGDLSRYDLKITGLAAGAYELSIDGDVVLKASNEEWAKGVNLTVPSNPAEKQAVEVLQEVVKKNNLYFNRWRNVQLYSFPEWARKPEIEQAKTDELARLDAQIAGSEAKINALRKPKIHHFELKQASQ